MTETKINADKVQEIIAVLEAIEDPELHLSIYELGLIYEVNQNDDNLKVTMTLTSPMCPFGPMLMSQVEMGLKQLGYKEVEVDLTFTPMWEPSEDLKMELGLL